jgi:hypothetical protein
MRQTVRIAYVLGAVFLLPTTMASTPAIAKAMVGNRPVKLEGMGYLKARKVILGYGWTPVHGACQTSGADCLRYPEIDACACCGTAPCVMVFEKKGRCLGVGTIGGPPQPEGADTVVTDVNFMRGRCSTSKSPAS